MLSREIKDQLHKELSLIGLNSNEIEVYAVLLAHTKARPALISKKTKIPRSSVYLILESLEKLGLVECLNTEANREYAHKSPESLVLAIDKQTKEMEALDKKVTDLVDSLNQIESHSIKKPKVTYSEGSEGARKILNATLASEDKLLRAFLPLPDLAALVGDEFMKSYTKQRIKSGKAAHILRIKAQDKLSQTASEQLFPHDPENNRHVKYTDKIFSFPTTMYIYDQTVAIIAATNEQFSITLDSPDFSKLQKEIFDFIWNSLHADT